MVNEIRTPCKLDSINVSFDDERLATDAGVLLPATLAERLGLAELIAEKVDLGDRPGAARPERMSRPVEKCSTLAGLDGSFECDFRGLAAVGEASNT